MDHRIASLKFLRSTGLIPVKVRPGQKDPFPEWDPRAVSAQDHELVLLEIERTKELNLGALFAERWIDIDVDGDNPFMAQALDHFLPRTPHVWGRKSKRKSHRVYMLHDPFDRAPYGPVLRFIKGLEKGKVDDTSYSVEFRGGKPENGLFSVLPGSIHPSGQKVEWHTEFDPTVGGASVSFDALLRSVRLALVSSMLAGVWTSGVRNDISLALAGTLWRIRTSTMAAFGLEPEDEAPPDRFILTREDAEQIYEAVMELSGDKHGDERQRMLNLRNTWRKLDGDSGAKVTGGKVLAETIGGELGLNIVKALYRLLSDNEAAETIEKLAEQYVMWYGQGVLIDLNMIQANRPNPWMTREQTFNSLGNKAVSIGGQKTLISKILFSSTIIHRVHGLTFDPSTTDTLVDTPQGTMVNQWRGFAMKPSEQKVTREQIAPFYNYVMEVLACGDEERAHWLFAWMADMLKYPDQKPGTALVLVGVEGAGKTFLGEHVLNPIVGPSHSTSVDSISKLTHNFNTIIDNKLFIVCNESTHSYQRDAAARLKTIITDKKIIIEPKGINAYEKPNHMRFMFTSNEEHAAVFISPSPYERRYTVYRVSPKRAQDKLFWADMHLWTPQALPRIMRWLQDYSYERWLVMRPMETEAKQAIQQAGFDIEVQWILNRIGEGFPIGEKTHTHWFQAFVEGQVQDQDKRSNTLRRDAWPNRIVLSALEDDFRAYTRSMGKTVYTGSMLTTMKRVFPEGTLKMGPQINVRYVDQRSGQITQGRIRISAFPSDDEILEHLKKRFGPIVEEFLADLKQANKNIPQQLQQASADTDPIEREEF